MTIQTATADRKAMAKAIAAHLGTETKYLGMPTCAYRAGPYTINRDGSIEGEDFEAIRDFLVQEGYAADIPGNEAPDDSRNESIESFVVFFAVRTMFGIRNIDHVNARIHLSDSFRDGRAASS